MGIALTNATVTAVDDELRTLTARNSAGSVHCVTLPFVP